MNIGKAAQKTGVSMKMIRHYESIGAIPRPARSQSGYRNYEAADIERLRFIGRARSAGFSIADIKKLTSLWQDRRRPAREVKRIALVHLGQINPRIEELKIIAGALSHLTAHCHGDDRPECPILESLAEAVSSEEADLYRIRPRRQVPRRQSR